MRIGLSASSIEPSRNRGVVDGMGHYTLQVDSGLRNRGYTVNRYSFPRFRGESKFEYSKKLPRSFVSQLFLSSTFRRHSLDLDVDVFHCTDYKIVPMKQPVVATIWDAISFVHPEWFSGSLRKRFTPMIFRKSAEFADKVIAVSNHAAEDISKNFKVPESKIEVVPWCISDSWLDNISDNEVLETCRRFGLKENFILSVGTLQPRKNFDRLIDAFLMLPHELKRDRKLVIVGKPGWCCEPTLAKIKKHKEFVVHLSEVTDEELKALYQAADLFAFPSLYEGFGMPPLEAFASNIPVVASNLTSIPEVVGDAAILVDPYSIKDTSNGLANVLANPREASNLIRKGQRRLQIFSEKSMISSLANIYNGMV